MWFRSCMWCTSAEHSLDALAELVAVVMPQSLRIQLVMVEDPRQGLRAIDVRPATPAVQPREPETPRHPALPRPTYWPAVLAFGITLLAWGVVTTLYISLAGLLVIFLAIGGWIGELLHEH